MLNILKAHVQATSIHHCWPPGQLASPPPGPPLNSEAALRALRLRQGPPLSHIISNTCGVSILHFKTFYGVQLVS